METEQKAKLITDYFCAWLNDDKKPDNYNELVKEVTYMLEND